MKKKVISWILIFTMIFTQNFFIPMLASADSVVPSPSGTPEFNGGGESDWCGSYPKPGDSIFYVEAIGKNLGELSAEVSSYDGIYTAVASQSERWYLGKTAQGDERYIYEMIMDGGVTLNSSDNYYVRLKDNGDTYYDNSDAYFSCYSMSIYVNENNIPVEITDSVTKVPFDISLYGLDSGVQKENISIKLYSGTKSSFWSPVSTVNLIATLQDDEYDMVVIGGEEQCIIGNFTILNQPAQGDKLYIEIEISGEKYYTNTPINVISELTIGQFKLTNAVVGRQSSGGHGESMSNSYEGADDATFYLGSTTTSTAHKFTLTSGNINNSSLIVVTDNNGNSILRPDSVNVDGPKNGVFTTTGKVDVPSGASSIKFNYGGSLVHTVPIERTDVVGGVSLTPVDYDLFQGNYLLPADTTDFQVVLSGLNLQSSITSCSAILSDDVVGCSLESSDGEYLFNISSTEPLNYSLYLEILLEGMKISSLSYEEGTGIKANSDFTIGTNIAFGKLYSPISGSVVDPALASISGSRALTLNGEGFNSGKTYTAHFMEHTKNGLSATPLEVAVSFVSSKKLLISSAQTDNMARGWYEVYLKENNTQINGFCEVALLPAEDVVTIINPTVKINDGAPYITEQQVTINITSGSFNQVRFTENLSSLSTLPFSSIENSVSFTLSDGFGNKTIYFEFKGTGGVVYNTSVSVNYRTTFAEAPTICGIMGKYGEEILTLNKFADYNLYIQLGGAGNVGMVDVLDEMDNILETYTLKRTSGTEDLYTYSKLINFNDSNAKKLYFYMIDTLGLNSKYNEVLVNVVEEPYITYYRSDIKTEFLGGKYYVENLSNIKYTINGKANFNGIATLNYKDAANVDKSKDTNLIETKNGVYSGQESIPSDAAEIVSIEYKIVDPSFVTNFVSKIEEKPYSVAAQVEFNGLPNTGDFDGKYLRIFNHDGRSKTKIIDNGNTNFDFNIIKPGSYNYSLLDSLNTYKSGQFDAVSGEAATIDLSNARKPASIIFNVNGAELSPDAYINYSYTVNDNIYNGYAKPNVEKVGLYEGMVIDSYNLVLPYSDLKKYSLPEKVTTPITLNGGVNSQNLTVSNISTSTIQITINDSNVEGRTLIGATVSLNQVVINGQIHFYYNTSGVTDENGKVLFTVYPNFDTEIVASKENYETKFVEYATSNEANQEIDVDLNYADQNRLKINSYSRPLQTNNENYNDILLLENYNSISYIKITDTEGNYIVGSGNSDTIELGKELSNQTIRVYPKFHNGYVNEVEFYTVTLDEYGNGAVDLVAIPKGVITADIVKKVETPPATYMAIYNELGNIVSYFISSDEKVTSDTYALNEGDYTVLIFSSYDITNLNGLSKIETFDSLGWIENTHYVKKSVVVENGKELKLGEITIPSNVTKDMLIPYDVHFDTKFVPTSTDGRSGKIYVKAKVIVSELLKNDFTLKSISAYDDQYRAVYDKAVNGVESNFYSDNYTPDAEGNYTITYTADSVPDKLKNNSILNLYFSRNGVDKGATFRTAVDTPQVSIIASKQVIKPASDITIRGMAFANSDIDIYDGDVLICSTKANSKHSYSIVASLTTPQKTAVHTLRAEMTTQQGEVYKSKEILCEVIDGEDRATVSNYEFINIAHYSSLDDPAIKKYSVDTLGDTPEGVCIYNSSGLSRVSFRINKLVSSQLENVYVINTSKDGYKTKYPATLVRDNLNGQYSDWKMEAVIGRDIGNISVFYSLKNGEDMGLLNGFNSPSEEDFEDSLNNLDKIEPANIPQPYRDTNGAVIAEQTQNSLKAYKNFGDGKIGIEVNYEDVNGYSVEQLIAQGFRKVSVGSDGEYYLYKDSSTETGYDFRVNRTMYFSEGLANKLKSGTIDANINENPKILVGAQLNSLIASRDNVSIVTKSIKADIMAKSTNLDTARNISGKVDYMGYVQNTGEIAYEGFRNRTANLGNYGKGMQVIGGVATAVQIFSGPASIDPANLRSLTDRIKNSNVRSRLYDEIREYQYARRDSHSISSLMGVVGYGSSFFSLPGKCLSYIVSTGNMVYTTKIDAEYNLWGNSIISQIIMQLRLEEKDIGEEDDPEDPEYLMDPSGYVFEAIENQRVEGITATAQTDNNGSWEAWDDEFLTLSEQENPQITDNNGKYGWEVPVGNWRVLFNDSSNKYQTALTKSMTVPPMHTEVNIGLLSLEAPDVIGATADSSGLEVEFSKYMKAESIYDKENNVSNIQVFETVGGQNIPCYDIDFIVAAPNTGYVVDGVYQSDVISSDTFVKRIRFNADNTQYLGGFKQFEDDGVTPKKYTVLVSQNALSYAGVPMESDYTKDIEITARQTVLEPIVNISGGKYDDAQEVILTTETEDAAIYYTTDGTTPTPTSRTYTAPILISESCKLKAIASKVGMDDSTVFSTTYTIGEKTYDETPIDDGDGNNGGNSGGNGSGSNNIVNDTTGQEIVQTPIFKDVNSDDWYFESVNYVVAKGLFKGITDEEFGPQMSMTRSMIVTVLYRLAGSPTIKGTSYKDIETQSWYENAVIWASKNKIVEGYGNGLFGTLDNITREQLSVILYRYAKYMKYDVLSTVDITNFADNNNISSWASEPIKWMIANGLLTGKPNNIIDPKGEATRAEVATILQRFIEKIVK
ncbi:hypothetical protein J2Z76_001468 [Sedimentibacter acidaminivorans]|uniref:SLH domain-containing protein n=1 Tax=Sedimentibacter acidaminivorans TaxID=913099 RepID=A0ABS4GD43_9FIRM|nr:S-layer homology domain-containing protein [Sedimentibacter acidaminivorans]MBP1925609.1 hypothetical protein [Sedimentibacter acidaminivorans]